MLGIYCRISKDGEEKRSIEVQQAKGIEFANSINQTYALYIDRGISGAKKRNDRPELDRLLSDVEAGIINSIYVYNQDRAARDEITWFEISAIVIEYEVKLYENGILVDLNESGTFTMRGIKAIFDADERRKTAKRFKDVLKRNAEQGRRFSSIQYGYTTEDDNKTLKVNEQEAELVRRIFALSLEGVGTAKIAEMFNAERIPTRYNQSDKSPTYTVKNKYTGEVQVRQKKDVKWKGGTIRNIITNPIYKGQRRWNNATYPAPAIFEEWYWEKVNNNLKNNSNNRGKAVEHSYLLKGLLRCGKCGANYYGRTRVPKTNEEGKLLKPKDHYYMCSSKRRGEHNCGNRSISIDTLDTIIWSHFIFGGRMRELLINHFSNNETALRLKDIEAKIGEGENEQERLNFQVQTLIEDRVNRIFTAEEVQPKMEKLRGQIKKLENALADLDEIKNEILNSHKNEKESIQALEKMGKLNIEEKRELIKKFIKNIIVENENKTGCKITVQFTSFGMNDEVYTISPDNKKAWYKPMNPHKELISVMKYNPENPFDSEPEPTGEMVEVESYDYAEIILK